MTGAEKRGSGSGRPNRGPGADGGARGGKPGRRPPKRRSGAGKDHGPPRAAEVASAAPDARRVAIDALVRIDEEGAYANLVLPRILARNGLSDRDRRFVTELVYGTTRHRRALDFHIDRFALREIDPPVRAALRLGTYQLKVLDTPAHAAVSATVEAVPRKVRGFVNAILRKIAGSEQGTPSDATRLSYPDWILDRLSADLGRDDALAALASMNEAATVVEREDGYIQDPASQFVAEAVGARAGELVLDLCAAPGGKATALAGGGARVVAADLRPRRSGLIAENRARLDLDPETLSVVTADGTRPPFPDGVFDRVLVDAPCSGLGSLRRRPDARWRIDADAPERLAALQTRLLAAAAGLVRPGGLLIYAVCTLTNAETVDVVNAFLADHPDWNAEEPPGAPWKERGPGALLLPQTADTDGMALFRLRAPGEEP